jgi:hypothetical protein
MGSLSCVVAALGAALVVTSCGGDIGRDSVVGPASVQGVTATDQGAVTASAEVQMQAICHYDTTTGTFSDLRVPEVAVAGHLKHGDSKGTCAARCPCFGAADFAAAVSTCQQMQSWGIFCASDPDINGGLVVNEVSCPANGSPSFIYRLSVDTNDHTCSREETLSGTTTVTSAPLSVGQETVCRQIIVANGDNVCQQY